MSRGNVNTTASPIAALAKHQEAISIGVCVVTGDDTYSILRVYYTNRQVNRADAQKYKHWHYDDGTPHPGPIDTSSLESAMRQLAAAHRHGRVLLDSAWVYEMSGAQLHYPPELIGLACRAWAEVFDILSEGRVAKWLREERALQIQFRNEIVELLRSGPEGVRQWNRPSKYFIDRLIHLRDADLRGTDLRGVEFGSRLNGLFWRPLDMQQARFDDANLSGAELAFHHWERATFHRANLTGTRLTGKFDHASFVDAQMREATLGGQLNHTNFTDCDLTNASTLCASSLQEARFVRANLTKFRCRTRSNDFSNCDFTDANLTNASFPHAKMQGTDFRGAIMTGVKLTGATYDGRTRFPVGYDDRVPLKNVDALIERLREHPGAPRVKKAVKALQDHGVAFYAEYGKTCVRGVIKDPTAETVRVGYVNRKGEYCCYPPNQKLHELCTSMSGKMCVHLVMMLIVLCRQGELDPATALQWVKRTKFQRWTRNTTGLPDLCQRFVAAELGSVDWRPTVSIPEDYYAL